MWDVVLLLIYGLIMFYIGHQAAQERYAAEIWRLKLGLLVGNGSFKKK